MINYNENGATLRPRQKKNCAKSVRIRSFSGPHFPAFGLNMERYNVSLCIHSECRKIRTRNTPNTVTFHVMKRCLQKSEYICYWIAAIDN